MSQPVEECCPGIRRNLFWVATAGAPTVLGGAGCARGQGARASVRASDLEQTFFWPPLIFPCIYSFQRNPVAAMCTKRFY
ncbi:hypothetical protein CspeluHIS016_0503830 [Cutaneotrichosporon spelunceum]|uniref:Uncharacterized protein n=1 Tax=Cutaneotrichosporon spelunceum TaxID=1672016 RepID=A0AAD3TXH2_9TREE|nr:hypothetical protein CspeluHIS016_0503830 [Cutaneotrichosporon spelunceum]